MFFSQSFTGDFRSDLTSTLSTYSGQRISSPLDDSLQIHSSASTNITPSSSFSSVYGHGLVDAAAAVAKSMNRSRFADVPDAYEDLGLWGIDAVSAPEVWRAGYTGNGVVVAVVDTGVDYTHSDLDDNIWINTREISGNGVDDDRNGFIDDIAGWNFVEFNNNPMDQDGHGTHVAGTIAAEKNGAGTIGIAYDAQIMPIRVLGENGGTSPDIAQGILYAANNGADVINLSLGGSAPQPEVAKAIQYATERGAIVVMAAGNSGLDQPGYPAYYAKNWGIAVGAIDQSYSMADFSNQAGSDPKLNYIVAPGVDIDSTSLYESYESLSGTSMAAPHVSGVVALMLSANPQLTPSQVREILANTASA